MAGTVHIEVMIDTNANSRQMDVEYDSLREAAEAQEAGHARAIREFRDYLSKAGKAAQTVFDVTQRDTAQIFHEKTHLLTPELARRGGYEIRPDFLRENLEQGHYTVEPPIHGEERYYEALETFLRKILPGKAPNDLQRLDGMTEDTRGLVLQDLYQDHMCGLPKKYRKGQYAKAFEDYREVRFNAGEVTAIHFLKEHPLPPEGERTAFVFVGSDQWANEEMAKARAGKDDQGHFETFVVSPQGFHKLMEQVIRDIEREQPQLRQLRAHYRELRPREAEGLDERGTPGGRVGELHAPAEARAFSSFVQRVMQENRDSPVERGHG